MHIYRFELFLDLALDNNNNNKKRIKTKNKKEIKILTNQKIRIN